MHRTTELVRLEDPSNKTNLGHHLETNEQLLLQSHRRSYNYELGPLVKGKTPKRIGKFIICSTTKAENFFLVVIYSYTKGRTIKRGYEDPVIDLGGLSTIVGGSC